MPGFGEEYQGMTEREILVSIAGKIKALTEQVDVIKFPSPLCAVHTGTIKEHDKRIQTMEDLLIKKEIIKQDRFAVWGLIISGIAGWGGLIIALLVLLSKGG